MHTTFSVKGSAKSHDKENEYREGCRIEPIIAIYHHVIPEQSRNYILLVLTHLLHQNVFQTIWSLPIQIIVTFQYRDAISCLFISLSNCQHRTL